MSMHECPVVELGEITKHPNADSLGIVQVFGYTVVVQLSSWKTGDKAVYIPPDYVVPLDREEFNFLSKPRVGVKRLRGIYSHGFLIPADPQLPVGFNAMEFYGISRYEPPIKPELVGENTVGPSLWLPKYDIENLYRYPGVLQHGEVVAVTEKIHGANARYVYKDGEFHIGSRTCWKDPKTPTVWSRASDQNPCIQEFCKANPGYVLYGEVYGQVQDLTYGTKNGEIKFAGFDVFNTNRGTFLDFDTLVGICPNMVPVLARTVWTEGLSAMAEGESYVSTVPQIREGIVIRPVKERYDVEIGRVQLKVVSNAYLERS